MLRQCRTNARRWLAHLEEHWGERSAEGGSGEGGGLQDGGAKAADAQDIAGRHLRQAFQAPAHHQEQALHLQATTMGQTLHAATQRAVNNGLQAVCRLRALRQIACEPRHHDPALQGPQPGIPGPGQ